MALVPDNEGQFDVDVPSLLDNLTQNDIDFLCKTFQVWHDFFFGEDNDNADLEQITPWCCSFVGCLDSDVRPFGGSGVSINGYSQTRAHLIYTCNFDGYNAYFSSMEPIYAESQANQTTPQGQQNFALYMGYCMAAANGSMFQCNRRPDVEYADDRCIDGIFGTHSSYQGICFPASYRIFADAEFDPSQDWGYNKTHFKPYYEIFDSQFVFGSSSSGGTLQTLSYDHLAFDFKSQPAYIDNNRTAAQGYYMNFTIPSNTSPYNSYLLKPFKGRGALVTTNGNMTQTFIDSLTENTYTNTFNYTTNEGDIVTTYYGDNYINIGIGGSGIGGGGGVAGGAIALSYNEFKFILDHLIDDLNINGNITDGNGNKLELTVPTFDQIKYGDQGDFYITPLEQLKKLPTAPDFETSIDLSDYPETLGTIITDTLSAADAIGAGLSALLLGSLFFSFLWNKLRG